MDALAVNNCPHRLKFNKLVSQIGLNHSYTQVVHCLLNVIESIRTDEIILKNEEDSSVQLLREVSTLFIDLRSHPEADEFFVHIHTFLGSVIDNPLMLTQDCAILEIEGLTATARRIFNSNENYSNSLHRIVGMVRAALSCDHDTITQEFSRKYQRFVHCLLNRSAKTSLERLKTCLPMFRELMHGVIFHQFQNIPIQRYEFSLKKTDYVLYDIRWDVGEFRPENLRVSLQVPTNGNSEVLLEMVTLGMKIKVKNGKFAFKKQEIPRIEDQGTADFSLTPNYFNLYVSWVLSLQGDEVMGMTVGDVQVVVKKVSTKVTAGQHSWWNKMMLGNDAKFLICNLLENSLTPVSYNIAQYFNMSILQLNT